MAFQRTLGLTSTYLQTEVTVHPASSGMNRLPGLVDFLERNYRQKSVTSKIHQDAELAGFNGSCNNVFRLFDTPGILQTK